MIDKDQIRAGFRKKFGDNMIGNDVDPDGLEDFILQIVDEIISSVPCQEYDVGLHQKILNWKGSFNETQGCKHEWKPETGHCFKCNEISGELLLEERLEERFEALYRKTKNPNDILKFINEELQRNDTKKRIPLSEALNIDTLMVNGVISAEMVAKKPPSQQEAFKECTCRLSDCEACTTRTREEQRNQALSPTNRI